MSLVADPLLVPVCGLVAGLVPGAGPGDGAVGVGAGADLPVKASFCPEVQCEPTLQA